MIKRSMKQMIKGHMQGKVDTGGKKKNNSYLKTFDLLLKLKHILKKRIPKKKKKTTKKK